MRFLLWNEGFSFQFSLDITRPMSSKVSQNVPGRLLEECSLYKLVISGTFLDISDLYVWAFDIIPIRRAILILSVNHCVDWWEMAVAFRMQNHKAGSLPVLGFRF